MNLEPDKIYHALIESGDDWADKDAAANLLEETKKSVLAGIAQDHPGSVAAAEQKALASQTYQEHVEAMVEARRQANKAKVRYMALQTLAELRRTQESTRRAEAKLV